MYPVDLHMHTIASTHAYSTLPDYVSQVKQTGMKLFAITDHGSDMADAPMVPKTETTVAKTEAKAARREADEVVSAKKAGSDKGHV